MIVFLREKVLARPEPLPTTLPPLIGCCWLPPTIVADLRHTLPPDGNPAFVDR
ncbi:MAG: hypothetical protein ACO3NZ_08590 [Pirellulales bacterium]